MNTFLSSYIGTALWSSHLDNGDPMDCEYDEVDLAPETLAQMEKDCDLFWEKASKLITDPDLDLEDFLNVPDRIIAHDFWLTRNRHGAGFWDGDHPKPIGSLLTEIAHSFGEVNLYIGDNGKIYAE